MAGDGPSAAPGMLSHYQILAPLGKGGMGEVYVAVDTTLHRRVALKAVRHDRRLDADARIRLLREAQILSQLDHPNICRVYDFIETPEADYVVLELIEGRSLREALRQGIAPSLRLRIAEGVAQALATAHAAGVVHRDLKPDNVMLLADGAVKVLDFGLARSVDMLDGSGAAANAAALSAAGDAAETLAPAGAVGTRLTPGHLRDALTAEGALVGTPIYMSPEQARGEPTTTATDLYAFGLLLQELYTGLPTYDPRTDFVVLLRQVQAGGSPPPQGIRRDIADLIRRLKAVAPSQRPTALETVERLRVIRAKPRRRLQYLAAAAAIASVLAAGVKYTVDVTRERTAALAAREEANRRREQAETLIGFMLGDLRTKLQRVGRLEVLDDVGQKAMAYFAAIPPGRTSDEESFRRSQAVHQIGQVRMARGDLKGASQLFEESLRLITPIVERNRGRSEWQVGLATSHFYVGDALRLQGDIDAAKLHFLAYRDIARELVQRDPRNPEWLLELSYGHSNVAAILEAQGDLQGARSETSLSLDLKRRLVLLQPDNRGWREALATGHNRLAVVLEKLGDARTALEHHLENFAIRKALSERYPQDTQMRSRLADSASYVGVLYRDQGDDARAIEYHQLRLKLVEDLVKHDPANVDWRRELGLAEVRLATVQRLRKDLPDALRRAERAVGILRPLAAKDPAHARRQRDAADAGVELAIIQLDRRADAAAFAEALAAETALAALVDKIPGDPDSRRLLAEAQLVLAEVWRRRGFPERAHQALGAARDALRPLAGNVRERRLQRTWALVLLGLGRKSEADEVIASLRASGFRPFT